MFSYTKEQIQQRARRGHTITFLKSKKVADKIAEKVEAELRKRRVGGTQVEAAENPRYPGVWTVRVLHIATRLTAGSGLGDAYPETNRRESRAINEILNTAYTSSDLLTSWTRPPLR